MVSAGTVRAAVHDAARCVRRGIIVRARSNSTRTSAGSAPSSPEREDWPKFDILERAAPAGAAAVDRDDRASGVARFVGGNEGDHPGDFLGLGGAAEGVAL